MSKQEHKTKQESKPQEEVEATEAKDLRDEELDADVDDLLDEIDGVLEENAEDFVASFIQKGGE